MVTGPYGYLVTKVLHRKETYKTFIGTDASMANLMRPALYGAYHHITPVGKENAPLAGPVDVTGSLCENNDKFAIDRTFPNSSAETSWLFTIPVLTASRWASTITESSGAPSSFSKKTAP